MDEEPAEQDQDELLRRYNAAKKEEQFGRMREILVRILLSHRLQLEEANDLAQQTLMILQQHIFDGKEIDHLWAYTHGIFWNVLKRYWQRPDRHWESYEDAKHGPNPGEGLGEIIKSYSQVWYEQCYEQCLKELKKSGADFDLFVKYNTPVGKSKDHRDRLAEELEIERGTLDTRISRIRSELDECLKDCIRKKLKSV